MLTLIENTERLSLGGMPVWKGFDIALLDDGMITWQGIGAALITSRALMGAVIGAPVLALAVHYFS